MNKRWIPGIHVSCVLSLGIETIIMLLAHLILSLLNSSFLCLFPGYTCLSHTLVIGNLVVPSVFRGCFLPFFPLVKFLLIAPLCCLGELLLSYLISLSCSLFGHLLFRQGLTSAKAVQIWQRLDNKSAPSWQLESTVHNLKENVCDSHEYSTASEATVLNWFCYRTWILHWTTKGYPTQQQNCLSYKSPNTICKIITGISRDIAYAIWKPEGQFTKNAF